VGTSWKNGIKRGEELNQVQRLREERLRAGRKHLRGEVAIVIGTQDDPGRAPDEWVVTDRRQEIRSLYVWKMDIEQDQVGAMLPSEFESELPTVCRQELEWALLQEQINEAHGRGIVLDVEHSRLRERPRRISQPPRATRCVVWLRLHATTCLHHEPRKCTVSGGAGVAAACACAGHSR
jgi:hypothetical protein